MKKVRLFIATTILSAAMSIAAFAGEWKQDNTGWWYQNDDGGYTKSGWQSIDGKNYYFNESGYMLYNTTTPDGYYVGTDGAWDGIIPTTSTIQYDSNSYQSILSAYTEKIKAATPILIKEYKAEAPLNTNGLTGLAQISNNKVAKLAEIANEGVSEMAKLYFNSGSGKYSEYQEWAGKLYDVYSDEAQKILDAYMKSAL